MEAPPNIKNVELIYPVRGYSFIPLDRVFGMVEKKIRKVEDIANPDEYLDLISVAEKDYTTFLIGKKKPIVFSKALQTRGTLKLPQPREFI